MSSLCTFSKGVSKAHKGAVACGFPTEALPGLVVHDVCSVLKIQKHDCDLLLLTGNEHKPKS